MRYADWAPTPHDIKGLGLPERQHWIVAPCLQTPDSGTLERANFQSQTAILDGADAEYETHRFGHWGPGWVEITLVDPASAAVVESIASALEDYPILDEHRLSELESEQRDTDWSCYGRSEFLGLLQRELEIGDTLADWLDDSELLDAIGSDCETEYSDDFGFSWSTPTRDELAAKVRKWRKDGAL